LFYFDHWLQLIQFFRALYSVQDTVFYARPSLDPDLLRLRIQILVVVFGPNPKQLVPQGWRMLLWVMGNGWQIPLVSSTIMEMQLFFSWFGEIESTEDVRFVK